MNPLIRRQGLMSALLLQDMTWLWRTLAATSCWAISDVICDGCIRQCTNMLHGFHNTAWHDGAPLLAEASKC
eukprot:5429133-Amphidinium_carterae.3